ncbi:hypothetical protein HYFRA_00004532 [Hymenoscyphus fraxineus]|uniref:Uncharacterized protein n=1 Tax=Hymenoscyphus fraxineus TaxID=746836 RepID=A0A9N9KXY5_9HELO|nr:hypothetical protein HYFRA_00004532 [Hymenoscyphus fraxineus]
MESTTTNPIQYVVLPRTLNFPRLTAWLCYNKYPFRLEDLYEACKEHWAKEDTFFTRRDFDREIREEVENGNMEVVLRGAVYRFTGKDIVGRQAVSVRDFGLGESRVNEPAKCGPGEDEAEGKDSQV